MCASVLLITCDAKQYFRCMFHSLDIYMHFFILIIIKYNIYTWKKVREHLLCYEGKLGTIIFLQYKYVLTKLFS